MLHVTYEARSDLEPGRIARISEDRGSLRIDLDITEPLTRVVRQLNIEMTDFLARADWFQLYGGEILSRHTPLTPLRVIHTLHPRLEQVAFIAEGRAMARIYADPAMSVPQFAAAANEAMCELLNGGCWFQLYAGEIIDQSPEPVSQV